MGVTDLKLQQQDFHDIQTNESRSDREVSGSLSSANLLIVSKLSDVPCAHRKDLSGKTQVQMTKRKYGVGWNQIETIVNL
jgi:hypothetical protein